MVMGTTHWVMAGLGVLATAYLLVGGYIYFTQDSMVYRPDTRLEATPEEIGLAFEEVRLTAKDGVKLHGWYVPAEQERGVVLFCHGNNGNISHRLDTLRIFHSMGLSTLVFDYRGYGESEGIPSEEGTRMDALAAWGHLTRDRGIPPERIVLWGRSLGAAIAARLALETRPVALALEAAFTSISDVGAERYPFLPVRLLSRYEYATEKYVAQVQCPVLVIHSPEDSVVPYEFGQKLYDAAPGPKGFMEISGRHGDGYVTSGQVYVDGVENFLAGVLPK
jgi:uncharacterized protein